MDELYDSMLITAGAVGFSMVTKKVLGESLGTPVTLVGAAKLAGAVGVSTLLVKWLQRKKYIPVDPFSTKGLSTSRCDRAANPTLRYMATLFGGAIQTTFAAVSFAGAGYLFKSFDKSGYLDEVRRHNEALEDLAKSKEKFYESEVKRRDEISKDCGRSCRTLIRISTRLMRRWITLEKY